MRVLLYTLLFAVVASSTKAFSTRIARKIYKKSGLTLNQININMPALSSTMKEGKIVSWNKNVGDKVNSGDVLLVVESDKADMDVESFDSGYLAAIYTQEGKSALVGSVVAVLVENVADISKVSSASSVSASTPSVSTSPITHASKLASNIPEFEQITMPTLSSTMKQGKIVSWSKKVGEKVSSGDVMLVVESDKADMDVEAFEEGFLAHIAVKDGDFATVGAPVGYLTKNLIDVSAVQAYIASGGTAPVKPADPNAPEPFVVIAPNPTSSTSNSTTTVVSSSNGSAASPTTVAGVVNSERVAASGYAQQQAKSAGIDLHTVVPSRSDGYIISKDLSSGHRTAVAVHTPAPGSINASPIARRLAAEHSVDIGKVTGSGNFGRVVPEDVLRAAGKYSPPRRVSAAGAVASSLPTTTTATVAAGAGGSVLDGMVAMDGMQRAVAKNMEKTLSIPVFHVSREIVTDEFDTLYAALKSKGVTMSALLAKAVALTLRSHPVLNAAYDPSGAIRYNRDINIAMAVAVEGGLLTPTISKADEVDIFTIARTWKDLVTRAKEKKLTPAEYSSGTFTISNLGMYGVTQFDALLPPGTGAILSIATAQPKVTLNKNGQFGVQKVMTVTLTCDHRHIYGSHAAEFLKDLADLMENKVQSLTMG